MIKKKLDITIVVKIVHNITIFHNFMFSRAHLQKGQINLKVSFLGMILELWNLMSTQGCLQWTYKMSKLLDCPLWNILLQRKFWSHSSINLNIHFKESSF